VQKFDICYTSDIGVQVTAKPIAHIGCEINIGDIFMLLKMLLVQILILTAGLQDNQEAITQFELQVVEDRLKIKSWHVEVDSSLENFEEKHKSEFVKYTYYSESGKQRRDIVTKRTKDKIAEGFSNYVKKEIWSDYYYQFYDEAVLKSEKLNTQAQQRGAIVQGRSLPPIPAPVYDEVPESTDSNERPMKFVEKREINDETATLHLPIDIRSIGFSSSGLVFDRDVGFILGKTDASLFAGDSSVSHKSMSKENIDGIPCIKTTWKLSKNRSNTTWFATSMGNMPIRAEFRDDGDDKILHRTKVKLEKYKNTNIWFPVASTFEEYENGKLTLKETLKITTFSLNEKLPKNTFFIPQPAE
jgi:hypothetical protein